MTITEVLASRVKEVREDRGYSFRAMAGRLKEMGHFIDPSGLVRLEAGERRVGVDDLMAIAMVLDVSPVDLLLPLSEREKVEVPGRGGRDAGSVRDWIVGRSLPIPAKRLSELGDDDLARKARWLAQRPIYEQRARNVDGAVTLLAAPHRYLQLLADDVIPAPGAGRQILEELRAAIDLLLAQED